METQNILFSSSLQLSFEVHTKNPYFSDIIITVPQLFVQKLYALASEEQQAESSIYGFSKGKIPKQYIEKNFQPHLIDHLKEFFLKYCVIDWLYKKLYYQKIFFGGSPRLISIIINPSQEASFCFSVAIAPTVQLQGWKRLIFKAPKRKNYKDLDRQVENFLKEEEAITKKVIEKDIIGIGDWIYFSMTMLDKKQNPIFGYSKEFFWLKIGVEESDNLFQNLFIGKKIGNSFVTNHQGLQDHFSSHFESHYYFLITIIDHLSSKFFCIDHFKKHFKIKNNKDLHLKLIEVFSYRNDISQRRATSQDALKLLLSKNIFSVPQHLVLRQEKLILEKVHSQSDYYVYKMQSDFKEKITQLAEKQLKEYIVMQQLAHLEGLLSTNADIKSYLNLMNRARTYEFIYFEPPLTKIGGKESPISAAVLAEHALLEKTLNHLICNLMKEKL